MITRAVPDAWWFSVPHQDRPEHAFAAGGLGAAYPDLQPARSRGRTRRAPRPAVDNIPVTTLGTPGRDDAGADPGADSGQEAGQDSSGYLNRLRDRALAGEIGAREFQAACLRQLTGYVARRAGREEFADRIDSEGIALRALANAIASYGALLERADYVRAILRTIAAHLLADELRKPGGRGELAGLALDQLIAGDSGDDDGESLASRVTTGGATAWTRQGARAASAEDTTFDQAILGAGGTAYQTARRRIPALRERAAGGGDCPFHLTVPCPHADRVIDLVAALLPMAHEFPPGAADAHVVAQGTLLALPANATGAGRKRTREPGHQGGPATLAERDHTLDRHFRRCFQWWWYRALRGTLLDPVRHRADGLPYNEPSSRTDPLRLPIVTRFRLKKDGSWDSGPCRLDGALHAANVDDEFVRLLFVLKPNVYDYLEGRAG